MPTVRSAFYDGKQFITVSINIASAHRYLQKQAMDVIQRVIKIFKPYIFSVNNCHSEC